MMARAKMTKWERLAQWNDQMNELRDALPTANEVDSEVIRDQMRALRGKIEATRAILADLAEACRAMVLEQGLVPCDIPWCGHEASHVWTRSAAELKSMVRKVKGQKLAGQPETVRCEMHVSDWTASCYKPLPRRADLVAA